jgi:hypothetical protein
MGMIIASRGGVDCSGNRLYVSGVELGQGRIMVSGHGLEVFR